MRGYKIDGEICESCRWALNRLPASSRFTRTCRLERFDRRGAEFDKLPQKAQTYLKRMKPCAKCRWTWCRPGRIG